MATRSQRLDQRTEPQQADYTIIEPTADEWDMFVQRHPQGHLLQHAAWGALKTVSGWQMRRVAVRATEHEPGQFCAGAQLLLRKRYGLGAAYVPRGPLFSGEPAIDAMLVAALEQIARQQRAVFLRLEPNILQDDPQASALHSWLLQQQFHTVAPTQPRSSIHVDLTPSLEHIFASFSKGHRADIRRAERQGIVVRTGSRPDIAAFYGIMQSTGQRAAFGIHSDAYYLQAWEGFQPHSRLLLAEPHDQPGQPDQTGQPVAGHLVFVDAQRGCYLYSGATEAGLKRGANHLLQWHALQWAREAGCSHYDLWGIPDALGLAATAEEPQQREALEEAARHDPLIGVYRFKKGFGGHIVRYLPAYDRVLLPLFYRLWRWRTARTPGDG